MPIDGAVNKVFCDWGMRGCRDRALSVDVVVDLIEKAELDCGKAHDDIVKHVTNGSTYAKNAVGAYAGEGIIMAAGEKYVAGDPDAFAAPRVILRRGSDIKDRPVDWLWQGWLACGKYEVLSGPKGTGKSTIAYDLGARLTAGTTWLDGSPVGRPRDFVVWSGEDDAEDTIMPRFKAAGGNPDRILVVSDVKTGDDVRPFDPANDMQFLTKALEDVPDVGMILIDPIVMAVGGDSHKNAETRRGLRRVVELAAAKGAVLIGITHFSKGTQGHGATERITGSLAFGAAARLSLHAVKGDDEDAPRRFIRGDSNNERSGGGFEYTLDQVMVPGRDYRAQHIVWGKAMTGSATTLIGEIEKTADSKLDAAKIWLIATLREHGGTVPSVELKKMVDHMPFSWQTLMSAAAALGAAVECKQPSGIPHGGWFWRLTQEQPEVGAEFLPW